MSKHSKKQLKRLGFEYKSPVRIGELPLLHISFSYRENGVPVPAKGIIAIGQFAVGIVTISQFGIGIFSLSQMTIAAFAIAQVGLAYSLIAQVGVHIGQSIGQVLISFAEVWEKL
jgi:hypothetical protein